ncbi:MAG: RNA methyltransferase, partial [Chloroflexota bacterium]|nr:RNA methyltransferase [Chloroflexota bacterium]
MSGLPTHIASPANPRIRAAAALRDRRERERTGLIVIDGARELLRALDADIAVDTVFLCPSLCRSAACAELLARIGPDHPGVVEVSETAFAKVAFGDRAEGVVAVAVRPDLALDGISLSSDPLVVVVEAVEKPGNLGAIARSADGAGADALIAADPRTDPFNPNAIRASLGTIFSLRVAAASGADTLAWLHELRARVVVARVDAEASYT